MYNVSFTLKTSVLLFLLLFWIIVRSEDYYNDYEDGSNFNVGDTNYLGVTVIVYLLNSTTIYCMGLLVNDLNVTYTGTQDFQYVLTSAGCVVHDWLNEIRVCILANLTTYLFYNTIITCKINIIMCDVLYEVMTRQFVIFNYNRYPCRSSRNSAIFVTDKYNFPKMIYIFAYYMYRFFNSIFKPNSKN